VLLPFVVYSVVMALYVLTAWVMQRCVMLGNIIKYGESTEMWEITFVS
jgi:hypothetical protein